MPNCPSKRYTWSKNKTILHDFSMKKVKSNKSDTQMTYNVNLLASIYSCWFCSSSTYFCLLLLASLYNIWANLSLALCLMGWSMAVTGPPSSTTAPPTGSSTAVVLWCEAAATWGWTVSRISGTASDWSDDSDSDDGCWTTFDFFHLRIVASVSRGSSLLEGRRRWW